ncbi:MULTISPECIES: hypothetical protein [Nocardia]|uniref:hypothetical protein n=1 Tax=Nocardia TaxID=1817 RepID=UPI0024547302|nr:MULTISPECIES: hypothetical protein [Nocardia]
MPEYCVDWCIDLTADTPILAALHALDIHRDPDSIATGFDVRDEHGATYRVDLRLDDDLPTLVAITTPRRPAPTRGRQLAQWLSRRLLRRVPTPR